MIVINDLKISSVFVEIIVLFLIFFLETSYCELIAFEINTLKLLEMLWISNFLLYNSVYHEAKLISFSFF